MLDSATEETERPERDPETGQFVAGHIGTGGRKPGSRNKLGEKFVADLLADWSEHGPAVIAEVRQTQPSAYLRVVASILPRELKVSTSSDLPDDELHSRLSALARELHAAGYLDLALAGDGVYRAGNGVAAEAGEAAAQPLPAVHPTD